MSARIRVQKCRMLFSNPAAAWRTGGTRNGQSAAMAWLPGREEWQRRVLKRRWRLTAFPSPPTQN
eukprot:scaffold289104_cov23-Prasinocladus_malaysianus.AAC.1